MNDADTFGVTVECNLVRLISRKEMKTPCFAAIYEVC